MTNNGAKHIENFEDLKTKAGWYPLFVAPLSAFNFHADILDRFKEEAGITLRCSKITFKFEIARGLPVSPQNYELLLVDVDYIDIFRKWLTSYRLVDSIKKEYHALIPTYALLNDPIVRAAGKIADSALNLPVTIDIITYSGTKSVASVVRPAVVVPPPMVITFKLEKPDPLIIREAHAYFKTKGIT